MSYDFSVNENMNDFEYNLNANLNINKLSTEFNFIEKWINRLNKH